MRKVYYVTENVYLTFGAGWTAFEVGFTVGKYGVCLDLGFIYFQVSW